MLDVLKTELAAVQRFVDTLQQEQDALVKADIDTLLPLSESKSKQAQQLQALAQQRTKYLTDAGLSADINGMEAWLASNDPRGNITPLWNELLQAGRTAQRLNNLNGDLISIHLQHNQQALSTLTMAANQASVYGADGQTHHPSKSSRIIGKV